MKGKDKDGECPRHTVSEQTANERKLQGASLFVDQSSDESGCFDCAEERREVRRICISEYNRFRVPAFYGVEDLIQDVMIRFWKTLPDYRGDAKLSTILHTIARNQLVDVVRKKSWSKSVPASEIRDCEGETRDEGDFTSRPKSRHREKSQYDGAEHEYRTILVHELQANWTDRDRFIWGCVIAGQTAKAIAAELGISPQAVSKRKKQLMKKTRVIFEEKDLHVETGKGCRTIGSPGATAKALTQMRATV